MTEQLRNSTTDHAIDLLVHFSFDLNGYSATQLVARWVEKYQARWIRLAVIEALYQGRYKAFSVEQLLAFWKRRGQPFCHFNHEFERIICSSAAPALTSKSSLAAANPAAASLRSHPAQSASPHPKIPNLAAQTAEPEPSTSKEIPPWKAPTQEIVLPRITPVSLPAGFGPDIESDESQSLSESAPVADPWEAPASSDILSELSSPIEDTPAAISANPPSEMIPERTESAAEETQPESPVAEETITLTAKSSLSKQDFQASVLFDTSDLSLSVQMPSQSETPIQPDPTSFFETLTEFESGTNPFDVVSDMPPNPFREGECLEPPLATEAVEELVEELPAIAPLSASQVETALMEPNSLSSPAESPEAEIPAVKPDSEGAYQPDWSRIDAGKHPIVQFVPISESSNFYTKLKAVAQSSKAE